MAELEDYSGQFDPNLRMQDFSKDAMGRLVELGGLLYSALASVYYRVLKQRFGEEMAMEVDREVWRRMPLIEIRETAKAMNISGSDVAAIFKICQISPTDSAMGILNALYELRDSNHGIVTYVDCPSLRYFEKHREAALYRHVCAGIEVDWFNQCARFVNPNAKAKPLKLPPRSRCDDIACQWEFKIETQA